VVRRSRSRRCLLTFGTGQWVTGEPEKSVWRSRSRRRCLLASGAAEGLSSAASGLANGSALLVDVRRGLVERGAGLSSVPEVGAAVSGLASSKKKMSLRPGAFQAIAPGAGASLRHWSNDARYWCYTGRAPV
jgi:hypothetical protein